MSQITESLRYYLFHCNDFTLLCNFSSFCLCEWLFLNGLGRSFNFTGLILDGQKWPITFSTAIILLCSAISPPFASASDFFSMAWVVLDEMTSSSSSQAKVFSVTATFCEANFSLSSFSCSLASISLVIPPANRSHWKPQPKIEYQFTRNF